VEERETEFIYTIHRARSAGVATISINQYASSRLASFLGGLKWVSGGLEFRVNEQRCTAMGDEVCEFIIRRNPLLGPGCGNPKTTLLIIEDDVDIADMLNAYFNVQGYKVLTCNWGEEG